MQIPEQVRAALLKCGLTPADWRAVREAFESVPEPRMAATDAEWMRAVEIAGKLETIMAEVMAREPRPEEQVPEDLPALEEWAIRRAVERYRHGGSELIAQKLGMGKTTLYRKLQELRISLRRPGPSRRPVEDILQDIRALLDQIPAAMRKAVRP